MTYKDGMGMERVTTHYYPVKHLTLGCMRPIEEIRIQPHESGLRRMGLSVPTYNQMMQEIFTSWI
jgi:hypothetical protein